MQYSFMIIPQLKEKASRFIWSAFRRVFNVGESPLCSTSIHAPSLTILPFRDFQVAIHVTLPRTHAGIYTRELSGVIVGNKRGRLKQNVIYIANISVCARYFWSVLLSKLKFLRMLIQWLFNSRLDNLVKRYIDLSLTCRSLNSFEVLNVV